MREFFQFTLRDLFWLTLVVAVCIGWWWSQRECRDAVARFRLLEDYLQRAELVADQSNDIVRASAIRKVQFELGQLLIDDYEAKSREK